MRPSDAAAGGSPTRVMSQSEPTEGPSHDQRQDDPQQEDRQADPLPTEENMPDPDADSKPDTPADLSKRSWFYVVRKTAHEFGEDQCTDLAAALTYYAVLAVFPAMLALISVLGVLGQAQNSVDTVLDTLRPLVSAEVLTSVETALNQVASSESAGLALVVGVLAALWSASGYVGAFGRAMNRIYEIDEGRPFWKLRPVMLLLTLVAVVLAALALLMLIVSGPLAESIGNVIGLGSTALLLWSIVKWPVLAVVVVVVVGLLYYTTPNVQQPKFRWISVGAGVAIVVWVLASVAFAFYVANFSSYNKTYGSVAGVVVTLLFLWITNLALLFGGELDAELERGRQLQAGIAAEEELQLPAKDTRNIKKARKKRDKDVALGRRIRREAAANDTSTREQRLPEGEDTMKKLLVLVAGGVGYVLGTKAGRERYDQIRGTFNKVKDDPRVQEKAHQAADLAKEKAPVVKDKVTEAANTAVGEGQVRLGIERPGRPAQPGQHHLPGELRPPGPAALTVALLSSHRSSHSRAAPRRRTGGAARE